ncbi:hypothetical protein [Mucilaginibacter oryzae]|nr:hypothetical protein [Mucilaginibacter oryzae]
MAGLRQSPRRFAEMFYFDKRDNQFFSILITDYFLFEDDFSIASNAQSSYSEDTLILLAEKMSRIAQNDISIIEIPRLGEGLDDYEQKAESFLNLNAISIEKATLWDIEDSGTINIKITD